MSEHGAMTAWGLLWRLFWVFGGFALVTMLTARVLVESSEWFEPVRGKRSSVDCVVAMFVWLLGLVIATVTAR